MRLAYFVNEYPAVSHSFIRREIRAVEALGMTVARYALRSAADELVDETDKAEHALTSFVLRKTPWRNLACLLQTISSQPAGLVRAAALALRIGWRSDRGLARHIAYLIEAAVVAQWCRRDGIEHLHAHFGTNSAAIAMLVNELIGLPYSFTVHGPDEFDKPEFLALGEKVRRSAFAVAISSYGRSQLLRWTPPEHWHKVKIVHCGIDAGFHTGQIKPVPEEPRLVSIGRLSAAKGHLLLIEAVRRLRDEGLNLQLTIIGDGSMRPAIAARIAQDGLAKQVRLAGSLSSAQVREEIENARALVVSSFAEGLPVVMMEAMALERPVISTRIAGIPELMVEGETGWLVPAGDEAALAQAMREVVTADRERLMQIGRAGRRRVIERHDVEREAMMLVAHMAADSHQRD